MWGILRGTKMGRAIFAFLPQSGSKSQGWGCCKQALSFILRRPDQAQLGLPLRLLLHHHSNRAPKRSLPLQKNQSIDSIGILETV